MFAITSTRTHTHTRTQIQYYCWCSCLLLLLYSSFNSLPRGRCPPPTAHCCSAEHCFLFFRPLLRCPFLLVAAFWLIIFCFYTHLNHFTVILLIANFKLLPCGLLPPISHPQTSPSHCLAFLCRLHFPRCSLFVVIPPTETDNLLNLPLVPRLLC